MTPFQDSHGLIPYGRQQIDGEDINAVVNALCSDWLTTGPMVADFETAVAGYAGVEYGVAVSSGTAALHAAMHATGIKPGDEVIVPAITFVSTANCVVFQGARPVFADVDPDALLIDPESVKANISEKTRAIIAVDYAGQPCDYGELKRIASDHGLTLIADGCHALGAEYKGKRVGSLADLTVFSFHPVKHITTGEGGMIMTDDRGLAEKMRLFRNHGIDSDHRQRESLGTWQYDMVELGFNYRITDIQCALGISQLRKLPGWLEKRRRIAGLYNESVKTLEGVMPLDVRPDVSHAYHLFVVRCVSPVDRAGLFHEMRACGIGVNVHYKPVHLHRFYRERFNTGPGLCPVAETASENILSLPMHPGLTDADVNRVVKALERSLDKLIKRNQ